MSSNTGADTAALVLMVIGLVAAAVMLFDIPFAIAPIGFLAVLIAAGLSARHRRLGVSAMGIVSVCFLIGTSIAVWQSNPLF